MESKTKMKAKSFLAFFVVLAALAITVFPNVSAANNFVDITSLEVDGISLSFGDGAITNELVGVEAGSQIPVKVVFNALETQEEVKIYARLRTSGDFEEVTGDFAVLEGRTYTKTLMVQVPQDVDPNERIELIVTIESQADYGDHKIVDLEVQRANDRLDILSVDMQNEVKAGENLALDVVLENMGRQVADNTYVEVRIPELGVSKRALFGDLYPQDNSSDDEENARERRINLLIPKGTPEGLYTVEVRAYNSDTSSTFSRSVFVLGSSDESMVFASSGSKKFAVGEEQRYTFTLVNAGDSIKVYNLVVDADGQLNVELDESVVVVPAGSSKTVELTVTADDEGTYDFAVNVHSDGALINTAQFTANVEGTQAFAGSAAVLLTVVLAIVFVVLLVVLIVLLTRKPERKEDFGESYY